MFKKKVMYVININCTIFYTLQLNMQHKYSDIFCAFHFGVDFN